jgi:hypothetical protein
MLIEFCWKIMTVGIAKYYVYTGITSGVGLKELIHHSCTKSFPHFFFFCNGFVNILFYSIRCHPPVRGSLLM